MNEETAPYAVTQAQAQSAADIPLAPAMVDAAGDARVVNNVLRHEYRVLSDAEKACMQKIKDDALALHNFLESLGVSRELSVAKTKLEEAVMWAVKHVTK
jgi:hypothetical protein